MVGFVGTFYITQNTTVEQSTDGSVYGSIRLEYEKITSASTFKAGKVPVSPLVVVGGPNLDFEFDTFKIEYYNLIEVII